jgi:hypothetical protein
MCRVRLVPDVPRGSLARTIIEVPKKSPGCNEPGLQGGQLHAPPILSKAQIHIKGCPKNAARRPKKDPVSGRSRASRGQPPGGRGTLGCLPRSRKHCLHRPREAVGRCHRAHSASAVIGRRALRYLAGAPEGVTEALTLAHGFPVPCWWICALPASRSRHPSGWSLADDPSRSFA